MNKKITFDINSILKPILQGEKPIQKSQISMVVMISVLATTLILSGTSHAYALQSLGENPSIGRVGPSHFGFATKEIVCGDHLCKDIAFKSKSIVNEVNTKSSQKSSDHNPSITTEQIYKYSKGAGDAYIALFKVKDSDKNLSNVQIAVQSDLDQTNIPLEGLFTKDTQVVEVRIHATDPPINNGFPSELAVQ